MTDYGRSFFVNYEETYSCCDTAMNTVRRIVVILVDSESTVHDRVGEDKLVRIRVEADSSIATVKWDRGEDDFDLSSGSVVDSNPFEICRIAIASKVVEGEVGGVDNVECIVRVGSSGEKHFTLTAFDQVIL